MKIYYFQIRISKINKHTESFAKAIQVPPTDPNKFKSATIIIMHFYLKTAGVADNRIFNRG